MFKVRAIGPLVAVVVVGGVLSACSSTPDNFGDGYGARDACRDWVKQELKAPSTAKFSGESGYSSDAGPWTIIGSVDAQNSFGAMLRNQYTCTVRLDGQYYRGNANLFGN